VAQPGPRRVGTVFPKFALPCSIKHIPHRRRLAP
jgi:hypothetical protein